VLRVLHAHGAADVRIANRLVPGPVNE
jgi:hypothetical protein